MISYPKELDGETTENDNPTSLQSLTLQIKTTIMDFIKIIKNKDSLIAIINSSIFDGAFKTIKNYLQPIIKQYIILAPILINLNKDKKIPLAIGLVYFILYLLNSIASKNSGNFSNKIKSLPLAINITYLTGALIILASGITFHFKFYIIPILLFILLSIIVNLKRPMSIGYISELIPNKIMATGLSGESQFKTIFISIFSIIMGFLADRIGIGNGFIFISIILLLGFPFITLKK